MNKRKTAIISILCAGITVISSNYIISSTKEFNKRTEERQNRENLAQRLIGNCNTKAENHDGEPTLSPEEGFILARGLGYKGTILKGENMVLDYWPIAYPEQGYLKIGVQGDGFRTSYVASISDMQNYLKQ